MVAEQRTFSNKLVYKSQINRRDSTLKDRLLSLAL